MRWLTGSVWAERDYDGLDYVGVGGGVDLITQQICSLWHQIKSLGVISLLDFNVQFQDMHFSHLLFSLHTQTKELQQQLKTTICSA